jgi:hypothetical protein
MFLMQRGMTVEERLQQIIGQLTFQVAALSTSLESAQKTIAEYEQRDKTLKPAASQDE